MKKIIRLAGDIQHARNKHPNIVNALCTELGRIDGGYRLLGSRLGHRDWFSELDFTQMCIGERYFVSEM
jgi:hypothetical protein